MRPRAFDLVGHDGKFETLFSIPKGTFRSQLPW